MQEIFDIENLERQKNINEFLKSFPIDDSKMIRGTVVTLEDWKKKRKLRKIYILGIFVSMIEFLFLRLLPRLFFFKTIYLFFGFNQSKYMSKAEILGRFIFNGYNIVNFKQQSGFHEFTISRTRNCFNFNVQTGLLISIDRIGLNGKIIKVYKLRTMHPYSEFTHQYMIQNHGFNSKGKISNDFRITKWGRLLRKYWIDELPQILNILKGDMKLVGVRPVGNAYFSQLPIELQNMRLKFKPGCIPPYIALNMNSNLDEVLQADLIYMNSYKENRFIDVNFFFMALKNIIFLNKRSS
jgi:lipopolysaccharide/colanic/teichoic acid biosynthesis glycosyltransferase